MNYIIKTMDNTTIVITEDEYIALGSAEGLIHFRSCNEVVNKSRIAHIWPEQSTDEKVERKHQMSGILHDGTHVVKHFGQWVVKASGWVNDRGDFEYPTVDSTYYPEVAMDCVPTEREYELKYAALPRAERKKLICAGYDERRYSGLGQLTPIKELLSTQQKQLPE